MKYLLWLLLPVSAVAQQEPPKGTNTIVIATTLSGSLLYRIAGQVLMQNGYTMSRSDKDSLHIQTQIRKLKDVAIYPGLTIAISEGKAIVTGFFGSSFDRLTDPAQDLTRITNTGGEQSPTKAAFAFMQEYAQQLRAHTGGALSYETKP